MYGETAVKTPAYGKTPQGLAAQETSPTRIPLTVIGPPLSPLQEPDPLPGTFAQMLVLKMSSSE